MKKSQIGTVLLVGIILLGSNNLNAAGLRIETMGPKIEDLEFTPEERLTSTELLNNWDRSDGEMVRKVEPGLSERGKQYLAVFVEQLKALGKGLQKGPIFASLDWRIANSKDGKEIKKLIEFRTSFLDEKWRVTWAKEMAGRSPLAFAIWMNIERPSAGTAKQIYNDIVSKRQELLDSKVKGNYAILGKSMEVLRNYADNEGTYVVPRRLALPALDLPKPRPTGAWWNLQLKSSSEVK